MASFASRRGRWMLRAMRWGILAAIAVPAAHGFAGPPASDREKARALAQEADTLLRDQKPAEALQKVDAAEALYHAPTHLMMRAEAQEALGRTADALATYETIVAEPLPKGSPDAFLRAQESATTKMRALLARVPSLLVVVEGDAAAKVSIDGRPFDTAAGVAVRLNPGAHKIEVISGAGATSSRAVTLPDRGGVVREVIRAEIAAPTASATTSAAPTASVTAAPSTSASAAPTTSATAIAPQAGRWPAWALYGVAGATAIAGAVTGGLSWSATSDLKMRCPKNNCPEGETDRLNQAFLLAHVSTAAWVVAGIAAGAGTIWLFSEGSSTPNAASAGTRREVIPWIGLGSVGVVGKF